MTSQTSQKTEDMLDQTFANFDTEVTGATGTATAATRAASSGGTKKSGNTVLFVGVGIAAVAVVGYMFVVKPMLEPPMPQKSAAIAVQAQPAPVADQVSQGVVQQQPQPTPVSSQAQATQPQVAAQNPLEAFKNSQPVEQSDKGSTINQQPENSQQVTKSQPEAVPSGVDKQPLVEKQNQQGDKKDSSVQVKQDVVKVSGAGNVETDLIVLTGQQEEFKNVLSNVNTRVVKIEEVISEQFNLNKKVDERLTALESGKVVKKPIVSVNAQKTDKVEKVEEAPVVKKPKVVVKKEKIVDDSNVILDKSSAPLVKKAETPKEKEFAPYKIHSIYGGRLWLKNEDGSLSTYSVGDKLPSGEVIKKVDDEMLTVTTDSRLLKN